MAYSGGPYPVKGFAALRGLSLTEAEMEGARFRSYLWPRIAQTDALPVYEIFDRLDSYSVVGGGRPLQLEGAVEELAPGEEASTHFDQGRNRIVIALSEETYLDLESGGSRARFTVAHELAHAFRHAEELVNYTRLPHAQLRLHRGGKDHPVYLDTEWQANAIAAALLMPAKGMSQLERPGPDIWFAMRVAGSFEVSDASATVRVDKYRARRDALLNW
jgi:DNA-binding XRE family transcriptional regulator